MGVVQGGGAEQLEDIRQCQTPARHDEGTLATNCSAGKGGERVPCQQPTCMLPHMPEKQLADLIITSSMVFHGARVPRTLRGAMDSGSHITGKNITWLWMILKYLPELLRAMAESCVVRGLVYGEPVDVISTPPTSASEPTPWSRSVLPILGSIGVRVRWESWWRRCRRLLVATVPEALAVFPDGFGCENELQAAYFRARPVHLGKRQRHL